ncbi:serine hydrolase domain-containing protein [Tahibacter sp.]|uniref:serine hydrolase domain-containing protein n=1 Tax=Tahibacter sp. TaxID=2056211 RepID=UPI0028C4D896|nr:serine hydrolase domain-containing protein [Tahibacter sp.]
MLGQWVLGAVMWLSAMAGAMAAAENPADVRPVDKAVLSAAVAARLEQALAAGFSGSVLIADADSVVFEHSYGQADPANGAPVRADTRFNLASSGKMFTAVAVLQLVQQGKLDLDAPIGRYLPDWPVARVRDTVTPRQLLTHTSGLGSYWGASFQAARATLRTLGDYAPLLAQEPAFEPGQGWQYSNSGFMLLGLLVEAASGEDYYDYVAKHIFEPAGMRDSGYFELDGKAERVAIPHHGGGGAEKDRRYAMPEPRGGGAGGGYSTPKDLLRFHRALTSGTLLDARTYALLMSAVPLPSAERGRPPHGLGMLRYEVGEDVAYGHPGGAQGIGVDFRAGSSSGWALIVMSNVSDPFAMEIGTDLARIIAEAGGQDLRFPGMRARGAGKRMP